MKINSQQFIDLAVETESGQQLGKLESFNLETESQSVLEYIIKPSNIVKDLITKDLIIPRGQVIEITERKMIVEDLIMGEKNKVKEKVRQKVPEGAALKQK